MNLNQATIAGRLARDPEMKALPSGIKVTNITLVTSRIWKDKQGAKKEAPDFHNVIVFGNQAEASAKFLKKGQLCLVIGRLQTRSWEKDDKTKQYRTEIVAQTVQFGPRPHKDGVDDIPADSGKQEEPQGKKPSKSYVGSFDAPIEYPTEEINPEDIPF